MFFRKNQSSIEWTLYFLLKWCWKVWFCYIMLLPYKSSPQNKFLATRYQILWRTLWCKVCHIRFHGPQTRRSKNINKVFCWKRPSGKIYRGHWNDQMHINWRGFNSNRTTIIITTLLSWFCMIYYFQLIIFVCFLRELILHEALKAGLTLLQ